MLIGHKSRNHPQQVARDGVDDTVDDRRTPASVFDPLHAVYWYDLDVAASGANAKCARFFTRETNGLVQPWNGTVWCNPPYSDLASWGVQFLAGRIRFGRPEGVPLPKKGDRPPFGLVVVQWGRL